MKEFEGSNFLYPSKKTLLLTIHINSLFYSVIEKLIKAQKRGIKQILKHLINLLCKKYMLDICSNIVMISL